MSANPEAGPASARIPHKEVIACGPPLGAELCDIDASTDVSRQMPAVLDAFTRHHLLFIRDQKMIDQHIYEFASRFGHIENHKNRDATGNVFSVAHGITNLDAEGKAWLAANGRLELFRLHPYSPEFNPIEGVWKQTKKRTTHNTFFRTTDERDAALTATFESFRARPSLIAAQVARFL